MRAASGRHCSTSGSSCLRTTAPRRTALRVRASGGQQEPAAAASACKTCGMDLSKKPSGCDGEGRIIGGLGAVPGFRWWPIKAYRPCPGLDQAGLEYTRKGQATNEVLFGGVSLGEAQQQSLERMKQTQERGLDVDI
ncbi:hypothetical protein Rsub_07357 [Raphidocelis subcapitata]|uniref:Uncharacterized protein n=1 Tax=Raphidocelis subcapitata TaxID=307507 RepID=A0A2V0P3C8_9CHLO|nr:hypothetical protein Rsub_07357 [Raphidocelis subcapitata]|eukprot:GBF94089.1 hypothetical protein Rsub_07357 [Raphidocelis subcapitata]